MLGQRAHSPLRILCLGAHCDDLEIGCGATVLKLIGSDPATVFRWVVFGSSEERAQEGIESARRFLNDAAQKEISVEHFRDGFFPYVGGAIKEYFEELKRAFSPDLIFTHYRHDLHQDHRLISELTWNTFRDHLILEYEIPKYDGDLGSPNCFVQLDDATCRRKVDLIISGFQTQKNRQWFTADTFYSLLRLRGIEAGASAKYAEAFYCRKLNFNV
jgi:LmbE family N-acetylglucosaminyl deacetylase